MGKIKLPGFACCLVVFAVGIATGKTGIFYVTASMDSFLLSPVFGLAASICVIFLSQKMVKCRVLAWIGKNSLYFLCAHLFEMETMGAWFFKIQEMLGMQYNSIVLFCLKLMFITLVVVTVKWCQTIQKKEVACKH